jgi:hypothetical protein
MEGLLCCRPSLSLATTTATAVLASSAPRRCVFLFFCLPPHVAHLMPRPKLTSDANLHIRLPPPFAAPSSSPRCLASPSAAATGVTRSERCTPFPPRSLASAAQSSSAWCPHPVVPALSLLACPRRCCRWPALRTATPRLADAARPWATSSR